jgi:serine protease Do
MSKVRLLLIISASVVFIVVGMLGFFLFPGDSEKWVSPEPFATGKTSVGLGIIYLPVTPELSEYYGLGVEYGALITEVTPGSPADRAGLRASDVVISFNGAKLEEQTSLLGMMMACLAGDKATLEVWREAEVSMIDLFHRTS